MSIDSLIPKIPIEKKFSKVGIVSDSASLSVKRRIIDNYKTLGIDLLDLGVFSEGDEIRLEHLAKKAVNAIKTNQAQRVFLVDLSGNGLQMYANKFDGIIAVYCHDAASAMEAALIHNAQMCNVSSTFDFKTLLTILRTFLEYSEPETPRGDLKG
ncbi:MAG TPA: RpiB/LacA/LacB family sugar-phosphate isomerase [Candidatus Hodarchaeales archaeon]|nr:RpiB/LacA/LacB family sugar-phosphate isomerase [Candidatus Hodarchaeales archaeon]